MTDPRCDQIAALRPSGEVEYGDAVIRESRPKRVGGAPLLRSKLRLVRPAPALSVEILCVTAALREKLLAKYGRAIRLYQIIKDDFVFACFRRFSRLNAQDASHRIVPIDVLKNDSIAYLGRS